MPSLSFPRSLVLHSLPNTVFRGLQNGVAAIEAIWKVPALMADGDFAANNLRHADDRWGAPPCSRAMAVWPWTPPATA